MTINTYLKPLVDELLQLYTGICIESSQAKLGIKTIRVALACISSDIPATSKARHGCSKCMKVFPTESILESTNYSGFQREEWPLRDIKTHRSKALEAKNATSGVAREKIQREIGVQYSELLRLHYSDIVRCHVIDPMHNLLLGSAKNVTTLWKNKKIISESKFLAIQEKMDAILVPAHVGRLPVKIASAFSGFTAEQWMAWTHGP